MYIDRTFPRHLFIETTATCNLTCNYCPREKVRQDMDFGLFRKIIDEASRYGSRSFSLHLFGEPLLYPYIFESIAYIKQRNKNHTILLTTNGTKVNECIDDLVSSGVTQVFWTWRKEARFRESTLLKLRKWGRFRVRFIDEITPEEARKEWKDWPNEESRHIHNYANEIDIKEYGVVNSLQLKRHPCYHLYYAPAVAWNGDIVICCADSHRKSVIGRFPDMQVSEAWQGNVFKRLRKEQENGQYTGICEGCDIWAQYPNIFFGHEYIWRKDKTN